MWSRLVLKQHRMRWIKRWLTEFDTRGNWGHVGEYLSMLIKQFRRSIWTHEKRGISISNLFVGFSRWGVSSCANISPFRADYWHFTLSCLTRFKFVGCWDVEDLSLLNLAQTPVVLSKNHNAKFPIKIKFQKIIYHI
jgi:hypothetical protein